MVVSQDAALDLEEVEGLIRVGGTSGVGIGGGGNRNKSHLSYCDAWIQHVFEPQNRKRWMTVGFISALFILIIVVNTGGGGNENDSNKETTSSKLHDFVIVDPDSPTGSPTSDGITVIQVGNTVTADDREKSAAAAASAGTGEEVIVVKDNQKDQELAIKPPTESETETEERKPPPKPRNTKIPLIEPDLEAGPIPEEKRAELASKWGSWNFWDGDVEMRPEGGYVDKFPNKDIPGEEFPNNAWQTDAVYVNHYLDGADKLLDRAMESIFTEYGHGKPLPPEEMASRMKMFHWEKVNITAIDQPPDPFRNRGSRDIGGWTTKRSFDGLVRRLLHAMITQDTFTVVLAGHSAAQGQGNHFRQSYTMQFHRIMKPIFERLGVKLITHNMAQGGLGTLQGGMGAADIYGKEIDLFLWDSGMTEGGAPHHIDLVIRQVLMSGNRVPIIWGAPFELLKMYHEEADVDVGEWGSGYAGLPETTSEAQAETLPWAARNMKCSSERQDLCNENRFNAVCWLNRTDGLPPPRNQLVRPRGQVKWHPGWRPHQLMGRVLAFAILEGLEVAVNRWMEGTMTGQPLDDEYWHVTEYYENMRTKIKNLDHGRCFEIKDTLPVRMCNTPMQARTQYTPRANHAASSLSSIIKPSPSGWVPVNELTPYYEGPDEHNPAYDLPDGAVDVLSIVMGRRHRRLMELERYQHPQDQTASSEQHHHKDFSSNIDDDEDKYYVHHVRNRQLDEEIVPGEGWNVIMEPQGVCDGTYDSVCAHSKDEECFLLGHPDQRGAVVGCEYSGWLVMTLKDVKEGIIVVKLHTWHNDGENYRTRGWTSVNNVKRTRRLSAADQEDGEDDGYDDEDEYYYMGDLAYPVVDDKFSYNATRNRRLKMRSYETPPLPGDTFAFEYAINGKITSLNNVTFMEQKQQLQRVVETLTLLDDPNFTADPQDVEVAFRLRGVARSIVFGVSHIYWA